MPAVDGDAARPQPGVRVRQRQPPAVGLDPQQHRVVDDAAVLGGDQHVLALADSALRQVATGQGIDESGGIGPGDLDDPLDRHVPQRHVVEQRPILLDRVGVVARQVHVVVDVVRAAAGLECLLEERRAPVPRPEIEGRRLGRRGCRERHGHGRRTSCAGGEPVPIVQPGDPIACRVPPDGPGGAVRATGSSEGPAARSRQTWRCPAGISQPGICSADLPPG